MKQECMGVIKGMGLEVGEPEGYDGLGVWVPGSEESESQRRKDPSMWRGANTAIPVRRLDAVENKCSTRDSSAERGVEKNLVGAPLHIVVANATSNDPLVGMMGITRAPMFPVDEWKASIEGAGIGTDCSATIEERGLTEEVSCFLPIIRKSVDCWPEYDWIIFYILLKSKL